MYEARAIIEDTGIYTTVLVTHGIDGCMVTYENTSRTILLAEYWVQNTIKNTAYTIRYRYTYRSSAITIIAEQTRTEGEMIIETTEKKGSIYVPHTVLQGKIPVPIQPWHLHMLTYVVRKALLNALMYVFTPLTRATNNNTDLGAPLHNSRAKELAATV